MAAITWARMIAAARRGDYELLCLTLDELDDYNLTQAQHRDLANLIRDAIGNKLGLKSKRPKRSPETQALLDQRDFKHVSVVFKRLNEEARRRGKSDLRGSERKQIFGQILNGLPSAFQKTTLEDVARFARLPKSRRK
jgi:hypothetical protein